MKAKCINTLYIDGAYILSSGVKKSEKSRVLEGGGVFKNRGTGWGATIFGSQLLLSVKVNGQTLMIRIDKFFKENLGRLTEKRQKLIEKTMPDFIEIENIQADEFVVSDEDLQLWFDRCSRAS